MSFFKLLTGVLTGIAAFGGSLLHQAAPRADRTPPPARTQQAIESEEAPAEGVRMQALMQSDASSTPLEKKETFVLGTITEVGSSTITIEQGEAVRTIELTADTHLNVALATGTPVIVVGEIGADGTLTASSIDDRNPGRENEPLPEILAE